MFPILQIGPLAIQTPGLILIIGIWIGLTIGERTAPKLGLQANDFYNIITYSLLAGLVGARLTFVINHVETFISSPLSIISPNPDLLNPTGGILISILAALIYAQRKKIGYWQIAEGVTPFLAIINIAIPLANLASGTGYGEPTNMPWGITLWGEKRHPTQIYEAIAALFIFLILLYILKSNLREKHNISIFVFIMILASLSKILIERFHGDSIIVFGGFRETQLIAWIVLCLALILHKSYQKQRKSK